MTNQHGRPRRDASSAVPDAAPVSTASGPRARSSGFPELAVAAAVFLVVVVGIGVGGRPSDRTTAAASPSATTAPASATTAAPASATTAAPASATNEPVPASAAAPTRPPSDAALPYPDGCAAYGLSPRRCAYIADWALGEAGVAADDATIQLLGDPACEGQGPDCVPLRTMSFVVLVRVIPSVGTPTDHAVFCGIGGESSLLCTETPRIRVTTPISAGYHDVMCGPEPAPEGRCATPVPTIDPSTRGTALELPALTVPIDHPGAYVIDLGDAILPNGILTEASATLASDTRTDVLVPAGVRLEVLGEDGQPLRNVYEHGWRPGTERVRVRLVFTVDAFERGATLDFTDVVVR